MGRADRRRAIPNGHDRRRAIPKDVRTPLLIVGAGPFGLAMAAEAQDCGIPHIVLGEPMSFWRSHMPAGMLLRSACDWHLDPAGDATIARFLATRGQAPADVEPLALDTYLEYAGWFEETKGIRARRAKAVRLDRREDRFVAMLDDGSAVTAERVVLALGYACFAHVSVELAERVPGTRSSHTCDFVAPDRFAGRRVLIVGGRQSALESAALLAEAGAAEIHVCHRHATPAFAPSEWSWVEPALDRIADEPSWYRRMPETERAELNARFFAEGRLKLEPWLEPRVRRPEIRIRPHTRIETSELRDDALVVRLDAGDSIAVDHVLYATGYKVDLERVPFLRAGNLLPRIERRDGSPVLDDFLQSSVPGLFITSLPATREFGSFFGFTVAVRGSARMVSRAIARNRVA
jgi:cation diffusion facilitator CzcD-associated flavoprotein CzcO